MHPRMKSQKGVSSSGVRLLERATSTGYQPNPRSCGPAQFLRARALRAKRRALIAL